jgi:putative sterol carrier protein
LRDDRHGRPLIASKRRRCARRYDRKDFTVAEMPDPAQLAEATKGMSDEELTTQIKEIGTDVVVKGIFDGMQDAFIPEKAKGVNSTLQYDLDTDEGTKVWHVVFADGTCKTAEGPADDPRLTIQVGIVDFVRLIFGQAQGPQLFMSGKMKLKGDMMFAMQMQGFFETPK